MEMINLAPATLKQNAVRFKACRSGILGAKRQDTAESAVVK